MDLMNGEKGECGLNVYIFYDHSIELFAFPQGRCDNTRTYARADLYIYSRESVFSNQIVYLTVSRLSY